MHSLHHEILPCYLLFDILREERHEYFAQFQTDKDKVLGRVMRHRARHRVTYFEDDEEGETSDHDDVVIVIGLVRASVPWWRAMISVARSNESRMLQHGSEPRQGGREVTYKQYVLFLE